MKPKIQPTTPMINPCNACIHSNGMTVMCDLPHNRCTVQVSGWYYGKTAGLLGTYDNEPYTDMLTADNSIAADMAQLADGWTVGQRCQVVNRARQVRLRTHPGKPGKYWNFIIRILGLEYT